MPKYKDGTPAEIGDLVKGKPFNTSREVVGEIVVITSMLEGCNIVVAFAEVVHDVPEFLAKKYCEVSLKMTAPKAVIPCAEMWHGKAIVPCADYGSAKDFELVHRPLKAARQEAQPERPAAKVMSAR